MMKYTLLLICSLTLMSVVSGQDDSKSHNLGVSRSYVLKRINDVRKKGCKCGRTSMQPVAQLKWNDVLEYSAYLHAKDMHEHDFFAHRSTTGEDIGERLDEIGYKWHYVGENLAEGQDTFEEALKDWLESKSHCEMIMSENMKEMGLFRYGKYWVHHFGAPMPQGAKRVSSTYREGE